MFKYYLQYEAHFPVQETGIIVILSVHGTEYHLYGMSCCVSSGRVYTSYVLYDTYVIKMNFSKISS